MTPRHLSGNANIQPWIDSTLASLKTASAQQLAQAALNGDPIGWRGPGEPQV